MTDGHRGNKLDDRGLPPTANEPVTGLLGPRAMAVRRRRLAIVGSAVLVLVALAGVYVVNVAAPALLAAGEEKAPAPLPNDGPPIRPSPAAEYRGITIQLHSYWEGIPYEQYIREIAQSGANTVCFSLAGYQENAASNSVFIEYRKVPSVPRLVKLAQLARELGLRVVMMPIVLLENPGSGEWRGKISAPEVNTWWDEYGSFVLFYAKVAQEAKADMYMIGSELVSLENQTDRWRGLIAKVRKVYSGKLSYSANWDHYKDIEWWNDLDVVGMTVYYDLVGDKKPTMDVLLASWKPLKQQILDWQKKVNKPLIFTEVGWPSQEGCAKEPWNYYCSTKPDLPTQALCFQAFFKTWQGEKQVAGTLIWEWRNHPDQVGGKDDYSYIPNGKPAMQIIRDYFQSASAWSNTGTAGSAASSPAKPATAPKSAVGAKTAAASKSATGAKSMTATTPSRS